MTPLTIIWMISMALGLGMTMVAAASAAHGIHFGMSLLFAGLIAIMAIRDRQAAIASGQTKRAILAQTARFMGFIWSWAAANIFLIYSTLMSWPNAKAVVSMLVVSAAICLFVASVIDRNAETRTEDDGFERFVGLITKAKLAIACALFGSLLAAGQLSPTLLGGETKWIAVNTLMATALAMVLLSAHAIVTEDSRALRPAKNTAH